MQAKTPPLQALLGASKYPPQHNLNSISGVEKIKLSTSHSNRIKGKNPTKIFVTTHFSAAVFSEAQQKNQLENNLQKQYKKKGGY